MIIVDDCSVLCDIIGKSFCVLWDTAEEESENQETASLATSTWKCAANQLNHSIKHLISGFSFVSVCS
jgi:hypothetical protein